VPSNTRWYQHLVDIAHIIGLASAYNLMANYWICRCRVVISFGLKYWTKRIV